MAFDPTLPLNGTRCDSAQMRGQLQALFNLINAVPVGPAGPPGPPGDPGLPFATAVVDSTVTTGPGNGAGVQAFFDGTNVHFNFQIPQGLPGEVTQATLDGALLGVLNSTSNSSNGVGTLDSAFQTSELELMRGKLNELILALRR